MKTMHLTIAMMLLFAGAYAQSGNTGSSAAQNNAATNFNANPKNGFANPDAVWMKNDKVILLKRNIIFILDSDITLSSGMVILNNGTIGKPDGRVMILKEGEHLDFTGTVTKN